MKNNFTLLDISKLKCHERVDKDHVEEIKELIIKAGYFKKPIIVDKKSLTILDGHHRYSALKEMGAKVIPCQLIDYKDVDVRVYLRRKNILMDMIKDFVILNAKSGKLFPRKTTRHLLKNRITKINPVANELLFRYYQRS
ncbi:ParB N-terminal domain-containing protein [Candidatus Microgenomates bacterium]|nr:ParB N-terminal domain-containing protein [Candidatus Microgenomates bacterium]